MSIHGLLFQANVACSQHDIDDILLQGSPHLQKAGRLDFSLREHEGEVKAWQRDFQQLHRDIFPQKCVVSSHHLKKMHWKCAFNFANILLISFIFNFEFMFCTCIIVVDLIFVDFRFYSFHIEICEIYTTSKCEFLPLFPLKCHHVLNLTSWLFTFEKATNNSRCVKIIKKI